MMTKILQSTQYLMVKGEDYFEQKHNKYSKEYWEYPKQYNKAKSCILSL